MKNIRVLVVALSTVQIAANPIDWDQVWVSRTPRPDILTLKSKTT